MSVVIVSASHRLQSQSARVGQFLQSRLHSWKVSAEFHDLAREPLPFWAPSQDGPQWQVWQTLKSKLQSASAIVLVTPEWSGMATPMAKNLMLLADAGSVGHKAGLIVSVSGSRNGAYPVAELRVSGAKNNRLCWIPEHIIVRDAEKMLQNPPQPGDDEYLQKRIDYALRLLLKYGEALSIVRQSEWVDQKSFPNGM